MMSNQNKNLTNTGKKNHPNLLKNNNHVKKKKSRLVLQKKKKIKSNHWQPTPQGKKKAKCPKKAKDK